MKVSLDWVKEFTPVKLSVDRLVEKIGAQLGAVEDVIDIGAKYKGIVVAKIIDCRKHPNADKLKVCLIDEGKAIKGVKRNKQGHIEAICGAPNVAGGQLVAYMPPGIVVPSTVDKDPLKLEAREIRGVVSNGMIASAKELGLSDEHEGILVLGEHQKNQESRIKNQEFVIPNSQFSILKPGASLAKVLGLDDVVIDIENKMFTHRPDLFGMLGIAREIAGIQQQPFKSPAWYKEDPSLPKVSGARLKLTIKNDVPKLVPRFSAVAIRDVEVKPSPAWLQARLSALGVRPINNVVDLTNFYMLLTAQPLHAYDYDKLLKQQQATSNKQQAVELGVRLSKNGENLKLLGGKDIKLDAGLVVITDGKQPIGLGGVMGGAGTEVDTSTKNIILESANFDVTATRKTAMTYGLFTDAATRFTKNQSLRQTVAALAATTVDVQRLAGGKVASPLVDEFKPRAAKPKALQVTADFINQRLGLELPASKIRSLLENVEFKTTIVGRDKIVVAAPFWRTDIEIPEDIVEEVGRLWGYDHLPLELPRRDLTPAPADPLLSFKDKLRVDLAAAGANELLTYSFIHSRLVETAGQDIKQAYHIRNALSPDLQYYRLSLTPSLLEKVHPNIKQGFDQFVMFEIGKAHIRGVLDAEKLPAELERLAIVVTNKNSQQTAPYYAAKSYTDYLLNRLSIPEISYRMMTQANKPPTAWRPAAATFEPTRTAMIYGGDKFLGLTGEPHQVLRSGLKLPATTAQVELDVTALLGQSRPPQYRPLNRFPELDQDLTLKVPTAITYGQVAELLDKTLAAQAQEHGYKVDLRPLDIFQKAKSHKQITWRIVLAHPERTLTTDQANKLLDYLAAQAKTKLGVDRV